MRKTKIASRLRRVLAIPRALAQMWDLLLQRAEQLAFFPHANVRSGVVIRGASAISCGRNVIIDYGACLNSNLAHLNTASEDARRPFINIGDNVEIGPYCVILGGGGVTFGSNVHLGPYVHITSIDGERVPRDQVDTDVPLTIHYAPVTIEDHVLIGAGSVITPGVTIGHHSFLAPGSVIASDVPPYTIVGPRGHLDVAHMPSVAAPADCG